MMIVSVRLLEPDEPSAGDLIVVQSKECKTVNIITITITIVILITIITIKTTIIIYYILPKSVGHTHRAEAPIISPQNYHDHYHHTIIITTIIFITHHH
jgi:hypothetical protein